VGDSDEDVESLASLAHDPATVTGITLGSIFVDRGGGSARGHGRNLMIQVAEAHPALLSLSSPPGKGAPVVSSSCGWTMLGMVKEVPSLRLKTAPWVIPLYDAPVESCQRHVSSQLYAVLSVPYNVSWRSVRCIGMD
jgi:hypothetical protein